MKCDSELHYMKTIADWIDNKSDTYCELFAQR